MPKNLKKHRAIRNGKTVILLEHEGQVRDCIARLDKIKGEKVLIAVSPFAAYELDIRKIPYRIIEDYYSPKELYKLAMGNYKKVENLCSIIDKKIQSACPNIAKLGIKPALFSFYHLKIIYDAATIRLFQLYKLIEVEKPDVLYIYEGKRYPFGISKMAAYLFFDNRESIYAHLLTCRGWNVPVTTLPHVPQPDWGCETDSKFKTPKKRVIRWLQRYPLLFDFAVEVRRHGWRSLFCRLKGYLHATEGTLLLFGSGYNWDNCREALESMQFSPIFVRIRDDLRYWMSNKISDKLGVDALSDVWRGLRADDEFQKFFIWDNIDFLPALEERLQFLVERLTFACLNAYEETAELLKREKIKAFLAPTLASCTSCSAAQAARNSGIPVVTWQHGLYVSADNPMLNYIDRMNSDVLFVAGEGVVDKYKEPAKSFGTRIVPIGSPSLEVLHRMSRLNKVKKIVKLKPGKKVVLYVIVCPNQNNNYISCAPPFSDNHFWRSERAILDVLAKHGDYAVIIKTFPERTFREPPLRSYANNNRIENFQFVRDECTFTDLLPIADLVVMDFPGTPLLESLTTSKPIFLYTGHLCLDVQAQKMLKRRVFCYKNLESLTKSLDMYLSGGKIHGVDLEDEEFLKAYGVSSYWLGSGSRAAKMLKKIIARKT